MRHHAFRATRAMINGLVSLILGVFTLATPAGFPGLITGTLTIVHGFLGLRAATASRQYGIVSQAVISRQWEVSHGSW